MQQGARAAESLGAAAELPMPASPVRHEEAVSRMPGGMRATEQLFSSGKSAAVYRVSVAGAG